MPQTKRNATPRLAEVIRKGIEDELAGYLDEFQKTAWPEEKRFMLDVMREWSANTPGPLPKPLGTYEVPIFSALQRNINGRYVVEVPEEFLPAVNEYVTELWRYRGDLAKHFEKSRDENPRSRLIRKVSDGLDLVTQKADEDDMRFLIAMLERWGGSGFLAEAAVMEYTAYAAERKAKRSA